MNKIVLFLVFCSISLSVNAQSHKSENLVVITLDGYRWQEAFTGADSSLIDNKKFTDYPKEVTKKFWAPTAQARREKLMPFFWNTIASKGSIFGNRKAGNKVNVSNPYWFSYPGYSEIFTGYPDKRVDSNSYPSNPNSNVLEYINKQNGFKGKVAAFGSWPPFTQILNEKRSGFPVNAGYEDVKENLNNQPLTKTQKLLNRNQHYLPHYMGPERLDGSTFGIAMQYLKVNQPRVFYIALGDPDELAHQGHYDLYLNSAYQIDEMIKKIWAYLQSTPQYKDKTTLLITVDHGRGLGSEWTGHNSNIKHSDEIWFAAMGPDTPALGEVKDSGQWYQKQFAQTMARFLGLDFKADHPIANPVKEILKK